MSTLGRAWTTGTGAFQVPGFPLLWSASTLHAFAQWMDRTAVGWLVLEQTGSVFLTALAWTIRVSPGMIIGPIAGTVSDRSHRPYVLAASAAIRLGVFLAIALVTLAESPPIVLIFVLVAVSGVGRTFNVAALQPLIRDLAGPARALNAVSIDSFGQKAIGTLGALAAGILIDTAGLPTSFLVAAMVMAAAAVIYTRVPVPAREVRERRPFKTDIADGFRIIFVEPLVGLLLIVMVLAENLGFAFNSVLPIVADDILGVGASGLGLLGTAVGVGSVLGTVGLALLGDFRRKGLLLSGVIIAFGALVLALGSVNLFVLGLVVVAGLGACMAAVDALEWVLLQAAVDEELRGRAIGAWNIGIGFGWIGPMILGGTAEFVGTPEALMIFGAILALVGILTTRSVRLRGL